MSESFTLDYDAVVSEKLVGMYGGTVSDPGVSGIMVLTFPSIGVAASYVDATDAERFDARLRYPAETFNHPVEVLVFRK